MGQVLRDLIYFDFEKAASILSQIEGGLLKEVKSGLEGTQNKNKTHKINLAGIYKPELGGTSAEKTSQLESRILYHDLLVRIEKVLNDLDVIVDLNTELDSASLTVDLIRSELENGSYIRAEGWGSIEDYKMIMKIMDKFNNIADFLSKCEISNTYDYRDLRSKLESANAKASEGNKYARSNAKKIESELSKMMMGGKIKQLDAWFVDGLSLFADVLMPERINFRICPFESVPEFQIAGNLKRDCFVDSSLDNILFAYGIQPNVKLTIFGLITSKPSKDQNEFKIPPIDELNENMEPAFQEVFNATMRLVSTVRHSKYPSIIIYPIAVYRSIYKSTEPE